jgi:hypothetical protein
VHERIARPEDGEEVECIALIPNSNINVNNISCVLVAFIPLLL